MDGMGGIVNPGLKQADKCCETAPMIEVVARAIRPVIGCDEAWVVV